MCCCVPFSPDDVFLPFLPLCGGGGGEEEQEKVEA